jgi:hypothetical protein
MLWKLLVSHIVSNGKGTRMSELRPRRVIVDEGTDPAAKNPFYKDTAPRCGQPCPLRSEVNKRQKRKNKAKIMSQRVWKIAGIGFLLSAIGDG